MKTAAASPRWLGWLGWLPNALSAGRLVMAPLLIVFVFLDSRTLFLIALIIALVSDMIDGAVARALGVSSVLGAKLDSWGDFALYVTVPIGVAFLWTDLVTRELPWAIALVASFLIPVALGFIKFHRLTSYHTYAAKVVAFVVPITGVILLLGGSSWPFRIGVIVLVLSALEEVALTLTLPAWRANVGSILQIRRERRSHT
jgi:cardiolipin synthase